MSEHKKIWEMREFFDLVADGYDEHMKEVLKDIKGYYKRLASPITSTEEPVNVISLGCGTGIELSEVFAKCPNAHVTCVDISEEMLRLLEIKFKDHERQITLIRDSYETLDLSEKTYDYAVCALCLHHYEYDRKILLYRRIYDSLKPGGIFIEGDFVVTPDEEREYLEEYKKLVEKDGKIATGTYHVDVTNCAATELKVLTDAGFKKVDVIYKDGNEAVFVGHAE
jgi:tRNA (cmo5U34)-methyltransferase